MTPLAQKVREFRLANGLTPSRLAANFGVTDSLIIGLEKGLRKYVTRHDIERLAKGLGVPEEELWALIPRGNSGKWYIAITTGA